MSVVTYFTCDKCVAESNETEYPASLWIQLMSLGWVSVPSAEEGVMPRQYCPVCAPSMAGTP